MCIPIADQSMLEWLHGQLRVLEAWREELVRRGDADIAALERLDRHQKWLSSEITRLEAEEALVA